MADLAQNPRQRQFQDARDIGIYTTIPLLFLVGPTLGFFLGTFLEKRWLENPWGVLLGVFLGFGGAVKAMVDLMREAEKRNEARKKSRDAS